jgi:hypothetical protein
MMLLPFYTVGIFLSYYVHAEGTTVLLGECYVDGVMDGELTEAKELREPQEMEITLC